nr:immunoglobulin light chain junction region [Macaca mulatta]
DYYCYSGDNNNRVF